MNASNLTTTLPMDTYNMMLKGVDELTERAEKAEKEEKAGKLYIKTLKDEITALKNEIIEIRNENIGRETLIQLVDENLQSSKRVLQCVCAIGSALLGCGAVVAFPAAAGIGAAIAFAGPVPAAAGAALVSGAAGGYIVAPVIHEKTNNALIQQVHNFKTKKEVAKKV